MKIYDKTTTAYFHDCWYYDEIELDDHIIIINKLINKQKFIKKFSNNLCKKLNHFNTGNGDHHFK